MPSASKGGTQEVDTIFICSVVGKGECCESEIPASGATSRFY